MARQRAELKQHHAEHQKQKAMKQVIPGSDNSDEGELDECPNTMVRVKQIISIFFFADSIDTSLPLRLSLQNLQFSFNVPIKCHRPPEWSL